MRKTKAANTLILAALIISLCGCAGERRTPPEPGYVLDPPDTVGEYLRLVYKTYKSEEAYKLLTAESRKAIPYKDFKALLRSELKADFIGRGWSEIRVNVNHLKDFAMNDDHRIVYSLLRVSFPYGEGTADRFRLTKFHVHREGDVWRLEPFIHETTYTKRLLPSLAVGTQSELEEKRAEFYDIIGKDLLEERRKVGALRPDVASDTGEEKDDTLERIGSLAVPDLRTRRTEDAGGEQAEKGNTEEDQTAEKVKGLITVGKLHFQTGNISAAERSFREVLDLDEFNEVAQDFLNRCADIRQLQEEKRKQVELIEKLLELEEKEKELEKKSLGE